MLALLSPAKKLLDSVSYHAPTTTPIFAERALALCAELRRLSVEDVRTLMGVSPALAQLNVERFNGIFQGIAPVFPAVAVFNGDVYRHLLFHTLPPEAQMRALSSIRILSGLYGFLRPSDVICHYRLEMGTRFAFGIYKDLYHYWGDAVAEALLQDAREQSASCILNLASEEYAAVVLRRSVLQQAGMPVVHVRFKERAATGALRVVSVNAKRARGEAARFLAMTGAKTPEDMKDFSALGYSFVSEEEDGALLFVKEKNE